MSDGDAPMDQRDRSAGAQQEIEDLKNRVTRLETTLNQVLNSRRWKAFDVLSNPARIAQLLSAKAPPEQAETSQSLKAEREAAVANSTSTPETGKRKGPQHPHGIKRVQVGCGPYNQFENWWNVDIEAFQGIDETLDATKPWPYTDLEYVFGEHFLEHLPLDGSVRFLTYSGNSLRVGGKLRLSTPNLEWVLRTHFPYNDADIDKRIAGTLNTNRAFHGWGHQFLYTQEMLGYLLSELGFEEVSFHSYGESNDPELSNLERHGKPRVDESNPNVIIAEARRGESEIGPSTSLATFLNQKFLGEAGNHLRVDNSG